MGRKKEVITVAGSFESIEARICSWLAQNGHIDDRDKCWKPPLWTGKDDPRHGYDPYNSADKRFHGDTLDFEATSEYDANRALANAEEKAQR